MGGKGGSTTAGRALARSLAAALIAVIGLAVGAQGSAAAAPCTAHPSGGEWPSYGHDSASTRSQPDEHLLTPAVVPTLQPAWVFSTKAIGDSTSLQSTAVIAGGCVFVGSTGGVADASTPRPARRSGTRSSTRPTPVSAAPWSARPPSRAGR